MASRLETRTRVCVISHHKELGRNSNSARLIPLSLRRGHMVIRGQIHQPVDPERLAPIGFHHCVLFPSEDAVALEDIPNDEQPLNLIVPDGNWGQARRMLVREPLLSGLPRVRLPPGPPSRFRLRRQKDEGHVSTCEAVARALGILESSEVQTQIEQLFTMMVERTLWSRGELSASEVLGGIPEEAYHPRLVYRHEA